MRVDQSARREQEDIEEQFETELNKDAFGLSQKEEQMVRKDMKDDGFTPRTMGFKFGNVEMDVTSSDEEGAAAGAGTSFFHES